MNEEHRFIVAANLELDGTRLLHRRTSESRTAHRLPVSD
jgi:hypothetical protein